jgi:hypothetical protein
LLLVIALVATGFTRQFASARRATGRQLGGEVVAGGSGGTNAAQLTRMNSFALTLLLGGLRGPLVMILWSSSETQKSERNLQDFDTKVEWIRLLQPEFDTVHIFQMWNKAYNISVQMASLSNKYLTIIDAIEYGRKVDRERPDNINILYMIGSVYGDKMGDASEKLYYGRRVREESLPHVERQKLAQNDPGFRRLQLDAVLDDKGNVLPRFLRPSGVRPLVDPDNPQDVYDGSELPFLKRFEPYPYGVGPFGFAYNYRKRAQLLLRFGGQKHAQLSEAVTDSRPANDLKKWGEAQWDLARRLELQALGRNIPAERIEMESAGQDIGLQFQGSNDQLANLKQAIYSLDFAARLWTEADAEYVAHLQLHKSNLQTYQSHRADMAAWSALLTGDQYYLRAMLESDPAKRAELMKTARQNYERAEVRFAFNLLHYYVKNEEVIRNTYPPGVTPNNFATTEYFNEPDKFEPKEALDWLGRTVAAMQIANDEMPEEAVEYLTYIRRADARLKNLPE